MTSATLGRITGAQRTECVENPKTWKTGKAGQWNDRCWLSRLVRWNLVSVPRTFLTWSLPLQQSWMVAVILSAYILVFAGQLIEWPWIDPPEVAYYLRETQGWTLSGEAQFSTVHLSPQSSTLTTRTHTAVSSVLDHRLSNKYLHWEAGRSKEISKLRQSCRIEEHCLGKWNFCYCESASSGNLSEMPLGRLLHFSCCDWWGNRHAWAYLT